MADEYPNFSVRTVDFDGDGLVDILYHRYSNGTSQKGAYRNTGSGWESAPEYAPPYHFMADEYSQDFSVRTVDINGDGLVDILYHRYMRNGVSQKEAYLNTKSGWKAAPEYAPPYHFMADEYNQDFSVRTVDINGDGLVDILYHRYMRNGVSQKGAYLNTKSGWKAAPEYAPPYHFMADGYPNFSVRTVDFDGDGLVDILYHRYSNGVSQKGAYRNTGRKELISLIKNSSGCLYSPKYTQVSHVNGAICPGNSSYPVISNASSRMLVTKLSIDDGMGNTTATEYSYHNGLFQSGYRYERKNLGFEWTEAHNQETGLTTRTWYNQDPDTFYGLVVKTEVYRGRDYNNAKFFSVKENSYANNAENGAIELRRVVERFYNFTDEPVTTMVEYPEYDALGNRLKTVDYGEVSWPGLNNLDAYDDITKEFEYITLDSGSRYISVPSMEQTYAYTLGNRLATVSETRYLYDGNTTGGYVDEGLVTRKEFENGLDDSAVEYGYDDYGNLIWMDDARVVSKEVSPASGHSSKLTYDSDFATYVVSKTDADGNAETVVYDERMQPIKVSDINGVAWKKVYDEFGRVVKEIAPGDSETAPTKRYTYSTPLSDGLPNWVKTEVKESAQGETASYLVAYVYTDGLGRELQRKSEATGGRWTTIDSHYDSAGREWRTSVPYYSTSYYYNYGNERKSSDRVCSELVYDDTSRVVRTIHTDKTATKALYGKRAVIHMDPAGHVTAREVSGRSVYEYTYEDNFSSSWDVLNAETFIDQNRSYTSTKVTNFGDGTTITDQDGNVITTRLDMLGNKISYDDPDKGLWTYAYDENGNLLTQQDAEGNTVKFTYDSLNRVVKKTVNGEAAAIFSYGTDPAVFEIGQLVEVSFNGNSDAFTYDQRGRVVSHTRELAGISKTMQYSLYDSMDRIRREINPDGEELIHSYLHDGNLGSVENASGYTYISALDYEPFGNIQGFTYGNGVSTQYSYYDGSDGQPCSYRLRNIAIQKGGTVIGNTYYKYDDTDNITLKSFTDDFNGAYTEHFRYDHRNRLSNYDTDIRGTTENKRYVYDNVDNIYQKNGLSYFYCGPKPHAITEQRDSGGNTIRAFEYNANGDMTRATNYSAITITAGAEGVNGGQPILELWVGESLEMSWCLKDEEVRAYTWHGYWNGSDPIYVHYAADRAGSSAGIRIDRVAVNDEVIESEDSAKVYFVTGSFDPVNGVTGTQIVGLSDSELMDQHGALCFTNITSVPEERDFFYDGENRLKTLQEGTKFSSYAYDPWGERVSVIADGARTYFFFKGYEVRFEGTTTTVSSGYFANEIRIAQRKSVYEDSALASEELLYVHIDHLGSAVRMTDESGAVVSSLAYSPYGETLYASGDENTPYQFTGQHNDGNGIYYYGARYYDPYLGRFLQADSVLDGLNRYAYCRNNPVVYTDPTGEAGWLTFSIGPNGFSIGVNNGLFGGGINISWNDGGSIGLYGEIGPHAPDGFAATATAGVDYHFGNGDVTGTIGGGAGYYTGTSGYIGLNVNSTYNFTQNEYYGGSVGIGFGNSSGLSINAGFYWNWDGDFRYSGNTFSVGVGYTGEHAKIGAGGSVTGYNDGRGFDISWNANAALDVVYYHKDYRYEKNGRHLTFDEVKELGLSDLPPKMKIFHDNHDMYPELKYLSYCGFLGISSREYVFDGKTLLPMTDPKYIATYNYISPVLPPKKWYNVPGWTNFTVRALGHGIFDVLPYKILGN
ncbi:RHS repeat-associated core domain-containing protein [Sediminispirochaeta bajacaliforniensis]|uniref:RHS repeat-associated core domain-containing protein n=1 Tax=Sediminispirochaeta bajacaliforniensis TaxID=148 RepID=UPI00039FBE9A|nr:RHS repeat-associated core domain-containing protein [Sediminispirochaeta bajacaliforniensis]